jgi:hypothetical protein
MFCRVAATFVPKVCSLISSHLKFDDLCTTEGFVRLLISLVVMVAFFHITGFSRTWAYFYCRHISLFPSFCFQRAQFINNSWNLIDLKLFHSQISRLHCKITLVGLVKVDDAIYCETLDIPHPQLTSFSLSLSLSLHNITITMVIELCCFFL